MNIYFSTMNDPILSLSALSLLSILWNKNIVSSPSLALKLTHFKGQVIYRLERVQCRPWPLLNLQVQSIKGMFRIAFEWSKNTFNTQKTRLKKKSTCLINKIKSAFKSPKSLKWPKNTFGKILKMKLLPKSFYFYFLFLLKSYIS